MKAYLGYCLGPTCTSVPHARPIPRYVSLNVLMEWIPYGCMPSASQDGPLQQYLHIPDADRYAMEAFTEVPVPPGVGNLLHRAGCQGLVSAVHVV